MHTTVCILTYVCSQYQDLLSLELNESQYWPHCKPIPAKCIFLKYFVFIFSNRAHTAVYNIHLYSPSCSCPLFVSLPVSVDGCFSSRHWVCLMNEESRRPIAGVTPLQRLRQSFPQPAGLSWLGAGNTRGSTSSRHCPANNSQVLLSVFIPLLSLSPFSLFSLSPFSLFSRSLLSPSFFI